MPKKRQKQRRKTYGDFSGAPSGQPLRGVGVRGTSAGPRVSLPSVDIGSALKIIKRKTGR